MSTSRTQKNFESGLTRRLREAIKERDTNPRELSDRAGLGETAVYDILSGRNKKPSPGVLRKIAGALACPMSILSNDDVPFGIPIDSQPNLEVIGVAETGVFRENGKLQEPRGWIAGDLHPRFPGAHHFALEIGDNAMDQAKPFPLIKGAHAYCLDIASAGIQIEPQHIYAIKKIRDTTFEVFIRRAIFANGRVTLRAESSLPKNFPDITVDKLTGDQREGMFAIALIYGAQVIFHR